MAAPALASALPRTLMMAEAATAVGASAAGMSAGAPQPASVGILGKVLFEKLSEASERNNTLFNTRYQMRLASGGVDADIAAMRSWSAATKMRKQMERDDEHAILTRRINKVLWG